MAAGPSMFHGFSGAQSMETDPPPSVGARSVDNQESFFHTRPEFVSEDPLGRYMCRMCRRTLIDPMQMPCAERICRDCIMPLFGDEPITCPLTQYHQDSDEIMEDLECQTGIRRQNVFPDPGTLKEMQRLKVYCTNKQYGCPDTMIWRKLRDHVKDCTYKPQQCENWQRGCRVMKSMRDLKAHREKCDFALRPHPYSKKELLERDLNNQIMAATFHGFSGAQSMETDPPPSIGAHSVDSKESFFHTRPEFVSEDTLGQYMCRMCQRTLIDPMLTPCAERVCRDCIMPLFGNEHLKCPLTQYHQNSDDVMEDLECQNGIRRQDVFFDPGTLTEMQRLKVYCTNKQYGCPYIMIWRKLWDHVKNCKKKKPQQPKSLQIARGATKSLQISETSKYRSDYQREQTFETFPESVHVCILRLARAGFIYTGTEDEIRCPWCMLTLKSLPDRCQPLTLHRAYAGNKCVFLNKNQKLNEDVLAPFPVRESRDTERNASAGGAATTLLYSGASSGETVSGNSLDTVLASYLSPENQIVRADQQAIFAPPGISVELMGDEALNYEIDRLSTFEDNWPYSNLPTPGELAAAGFYCIGPGDRVKCVYCHVELHAWTEGASAMQEHRDKFPYCRFVLGHEALNNVPIINRSSVWEGEANRESTNEFSMAIGIMSEPNKHPDFAVKSRRDVTFLTWPHTARRSAEELSNMHFFYSGVNDTVICYSCGTEMSNLSPNEDLWIRHARMNPSCRLLLHEKGSDYVADVIARLGRIRQAPAPDINMTSPRMLRPRMDYPTTGILQQLGYSRVKVETAVANNLRKYNNDHSTIPELVRWILYEENTEETTTQLQVAVNQGYPVVVRPAEDSSQRRVEDAGSVESDPSAISQANAVAAKAASTSGNLVKKKDIKPAAVDKLNANVKERARKLRSQLLCKVCMDAPVGIVFLPCGDLVVCTQCAPAMLHCPTCKKIVQGTTRAVL